MPAPDFEIRLATSEDDLIAAQKLRYDVFVRELGGDGDMVDHALGVEKDAFDAFYDHLILFDHARETAPVVGVYRLQRSETLAASAGGPGSFYSEAEYDLAPLKATGRRLLELGRSCVHADYRGGTAMLHLWNGLSDYVRRHEIELMFGVASFHGTDIDALKAPLSLLHHRHLAPAHLRVRARDEAFQRMDLLPEGDIDRAAAVRAVPALIKAYLRLGGYVGEGAFVDHAFNTTDICLILDTEKMSAKHKAIYESPRR